MISYDGDPTSEMEEIIENVGIIASTTQGTVPFCRDMGIPDPTGRNVLDTESYLDAYLIDQIEEWEERAVVDSISFETKEQKIEPKVVIRRNDEQY